MANSTDAFVAQVLLKNDLVSRQELQECASTHDASAGKKFVDTIVERGLLAREKAQWVESMAKLEEFRRAELMYARAAEARGIPSQTVKSLLERQKQKKYQVTLGQLLTMQNLLSPEIDSLIRNEVMQALRTQTVSIESVLQNYDGSQRNKSFSLAPIIEQSNVEAPGYKRFERIAESANTAVFKAQRLSDGKWVALKFLNPAIVADPKLKSEFARMSSIAERLSHPNIVYTYEHGAAGQFPYVAMEYVEGETLRQQLDKHGAFESREAKEIATQVANALAYVADQFQLCHGNIKPDNIIVNRKGQAKILDFGTVKISPQACRRDPRLVMPTPNYCSPEFLRNGTIDSRSDVYSLGATLFHMLTGQMPFAGGSNDDVIRRIVEADEDLPDLASLMPEPDGYLVELVEDMTHKDPEFRIQDSSEVADKLIGKGRTLQIHQSDLRPPPELARPPASTPKGPQLDVGLALNPRPDAPPAESTPATTSEAVVAKSDDPLVGQTMFKKYKFLDLLGVGGMGKVYKAEHTMLRLIRAVKLIQPECIGSEEALERFKREILLHSRFQHRNVVQIYDAGRNEEHFYMAMECIDGLELSDILAKEGRFEPKRAIAIVRQVLDALQSAHANKIIHRDLKTDNIMITKDKSGEEVVKIMDFGIARLLETDTNVYQTMAGRISGTPQYMSPEQCSGDETDERSDLYSLGIIFYELLAGELPFRSDTNMGYIGLQILQPPPPFKEINPELDIHPELERVVLKLLEKKKEDRYQSARDVLEDLDNQVLPSIEKRPVKGEGFFTRLLRFFGIGKKRG